MKPTSKNTDREGTCWNPCALPWWREGYRDRELAMTEYWKDSRAFREIEVNEKKKKKTKNLFLQVLDIQIKVL